MKARLALLIIEIFTIPLLQIRRVTFTLPQHQKMGKRVAINLQTGNSNRFTRRWKISNRTGLYVQKLKNSLQ